TARPTSAPAAVASPLARPSAAAAASPAAASTPPATNARRLDVLLAANAALAAGNSQTAAGLYERVANTPPGADEAAAVAAVLTALRGLGIDIDASTFCGLR